MIKLKIYFMSVYNGFDKGHINRILEILRVNYILSFTDYDTSNVIIHGIWRKDILEDFKLPKNKINILWNYENVNLKNIKSYDIIFTHQYLNNPGTIRLPLYYYYNFNCLNLDKRRSIHEINKLLSQKKNFCCFLVSNEFGYGMFGEEFIGCKLRKNMFLKLNKIKKVNSGGKALNNIGRIIPREETGDFIRSHKFMICFENSSSPGYMTEKLFQAFEYGTIPIYWGHESTYDDINEDCIIKFTGNYDETINKILEIDNNDELYKKYLYGPILNLDKMPLSKNIKEEFSSKVNTIINSILNNRRR